MSVDLCVGCDHVHLDGRDKPCACGCYGFIRSMSAVSLLARQGRHLDARP
jgi:hypothetical protein